MLQPNSRFIAEKMIMKAQQVIRLHKFVFKPKGAQYLYNNFLYHTYMYVHTYTYYILSSS